MTSGIGGAGCGGNHWFFQEAGSFVIEKGPSIDRTELFSNSCELRGPYYSLKKILDPGWFKLVVDVAIEEVAEALLRHPHLFPFLASQLDGEKKLSKSELVSYFYAKFFLNLQACEVIWADAAREKGTSIGRGITDLRFLIRDLGPAFCIKPSNRVDPHIQLKLVTDPFLERLIRNAANYAFDQSCPVDIAGNDFSESLKRIEDITLRYQTVLLPALPGKFTEFEIEAYTYGSNALILILQPESGDEGYRRVSAQYVSGKTKVNLSIRDDEGNATFFAVSPKKEDDTFTRVPFDGLGLGGTDEFTLDELLKKGYLVIEIPIKFSSTGLAKIKEEKRMLFEKGLGLLENRLLAQRSVADKLKDCIDPRRIKRREDRKGVKGAGGPSSSYEISSPLTEKLFHAMKTTVGIGSVKGVYDAKLSHADYSWDDTKIPTITIFEVNAATEPRHVDEKFVSQIIFQSLGLYAREGGKSVGATTSLYQELPPVRSNVAALKADDLESEEGERLLVQMHPKQVRMSEDGKVSFSSLDLESKEIEILPGETVVSLKARIKRELGFVDADINVNLYSNGFLLNNHDVITSKKSLELKSSLDVFISESSESVLLAPIPLCTFDRTGINHIHDHHVGDIVNTDLLFNGEGDLLRKIKWFERMNLSLFYPNMQISFFCETKLLANEADFREAFVSGKKIDAYLSELSTSDHFNPVDLNEVAPTPEDLVVTLDEGGIKNISASFSQIAIDLGSLELYLSLSNDEKKELYIRRFQGIYPNMDIMIFGPNEAGESKWLFFEKDKKPVLPSFYESIPYEKPAFNLKSSPKSDRTLFFITFDNKGINAADYSSHPFINNFEHTLGYSRLEDPFKFIEEEISVYSSDFKSHFFCNGKKLENDRIALEKYNLGFEIDFILEVGDFYDLKYQSKPIETKPLSLALPVSAPVAVPAESLKPKLPTAISVNFVHYYDGSFTVLNSDVKIRWPRSNSLPVSFLEEMYNENEEAPIPGQGFFIFYKGKLIKDCQDGEPNLVAKFPEVIEKADDIEFICCQREDIEIVKIWVAGRYSVHLPPSGTTLLQAGAGQSGL